MRWHLATDSASLGWHLAWLVCLFGMLGQAGFSLPLAVLCATAVAGTLGRLAWRSCQKLCVRPKAFHQMKLLELGWRGACGNLAGFLTVLGTLQFLMVLCRLWPEVKMVMRLDAVKAEVLDAFPMGLELNLTQGQLTSNRPRPFFVELPGTWLFDFCGGALGSSLATLNLGSPDLDFLGRLAASFLTDPYLPLRVMEFDNGERVQVQVNGDLLACGAAVSWRPLHIMGRWVPAVVRGSQASSILSEYRYSVQVEDEEEVEEAHAEDLPPCNGTGLKSCLCPMLPTALRRTPRLLLDLDPEKEQMDTEELQRSRATLVFAAQRFANLEGFSFEYGQYWRYRKIKSSQMWRRYVMSELDGYEPLRCMKGLYCRGNESRLSCSRETALANFEAAQDEWPRLFAAARWNLLAPLLLFVVWLACVLASIILRIAILVAYLPFTYMLYGLLRHVDTPKLSLSQSLAVVVHISMPSMFLQCLLEIVWQSWGEGEHLHQRVQSILRPLVQRSSTLLDLALLWGGAVVIRLRSLAARERFAARTRERAWPEEDADAQSMCRICFAGTEAGRLISPCLCSGSMRFVHRDCLNTWRASSLNPQSSSQCDQCHFDYPVQRAMYASILRSSLVLHVVTLLVMTGVVLICGWACYYIDWFHNGDRDPQFLREAVVEQLVANISGLPTESREEIVEFAKTINDLQFGGIQTVHLLQGLMLIGFSGCNFLGFFISRQFTDDSDPTALIVISGVLMIVGLFRVFYSIFSSVRYISGQVLKSAESMILDIQAA